MELDVLSEFLIHAADVEGLCEGIDEELVSSKSALDHRRSSDDGQSSVNGLEFRPRMPVELKVTRLVHVGQSF